MKRDGIDFDRLSGPRHLFTAPLGRHHIGLSVPWLQHGHRAIAARATLDAALALREAELAIAETEDWLGSGILPTPYFGQGNAQTEERQLFPGCVALLHEPSATRLYVPLALLLDVAAPPAAIVAWQWQPLRCRAVLDALPFQESDRRHLSAGALVLCPASFDAEWSVRLAPVAAPAAVFGALAQAASPTELRFMPQGKRMEAAQAGKVLITLVQAMNVSPLALLGWGRPAPSSVAVSSNVAVMHLGGEAAAKCFAVGRLMPVGKGFGLHLARVR
ncbi:MAG: hypothetical protein H7Y33_16985 [Cytophagales bacterium]|nr:hypothetical protein [Rhizobacter sp.]